MINFGNLHISAALKHMHNTALREEETIEGFDDDSDDTGEDVD
jgi:hypothetical protein